MAATNYMTETDTESIWDVSLDTTRFGKIGVRIAEFINFKINKDATSQVTATTVTPLLEEFSEEVLIDLILAAKANKFSDTWGFISANITAFLMKHYRIWRETFDEISKTLNKTESVEITNLSGFGASNTL